MSDNCLAPVGEATSLPRSTTCEKRGRFRRIRTSFQHFTIQPTAQNQKHGGRLVASPTEVVLHFWRFLNHLKDNITDTHIINNSKGAGTMEMIKVFITEDESIVREGLRDIVPWEKYGFEFVGDAPDGEMALPLIRKLKPDVLITDIKMPFMDGLALSSIVSRELPDTKIIILSGYSDFEYARQAVALNVDQYLLKPITKAAILKALEVTRQKIQEEREQKDYLRGYEQDTTKDES